MSFGQLLLVLKARKWLITIIIASLFTLTLLVSLLLPSKYTATAAIVLDVKSPDPIAGMVLPGLMTPGYLATQLDLMQSERVIRGVIKQLHLTDSPQIQLQWREETDGRGSIETWLAEQLVRYLEIKPSRESSVINISFTAQDATFASTMANAFAQNYISTTLELRTEPAKQYRAMFEEQAKFARDKLEAAQAKLSTYQRDNGLLATDERLDIENQRLNELSTQAVMLQALSAESRGRQALASGNGDHMQEVLNNPVISALKTDLSRSEARLKEVGARFGDSYPLVAELKANIAETRARVDAETRKVSSSLGVNNSVNQVRELQIKAELEQQRQKVLKLKSQRDEAMVMVHDVEAAQRNHDAIVARVSQSALESQSNQTNVSLVKVATPPYKPSSPKTVLNAILSLVVGTMLAIAIALLLEIRDRRLRTEEDVEEGLGVPLLGALPAGTNPIQSGSVRRMIPFLASKELPKLSGPSV
ncbi:MAG: chain length determinant protein EpsF [Aquabacterium sp.]|nr:chain length determinant protein EpsF [Aquabacterium sp.]